MARRKKVTPERIAVIKREMELWPPPLPKVLEAIEYLMSTLDIGPCDTPVDVEELRRKSAEARDVLNRAFWYPHVQGGHA